VSTVQKSQARIVWAWQVRKLAPGRTGTSWRRIDASSVGDLPDGAGGDFVA
jgi:hypothetical protein